MEIISGPSFPEILSNSLNQMPPRSQPEIAFMILIRNFQQRRTYQQMSRRQGSNNARIRDNGTKGFEFRQASTWQSNAVSSSKLRKAALLALSK
ncbi:hypothetical protein AVEN_174014-1 [Araneus ventricosus]|uniref:Uncharacterized protein n=1 Tax=Araneus ventricosus TaxID=182803 RepID=A0A4Y2HED0_ARAVE|nr:hypothetical protein AVEN_174014-1 [Araneus ventricosus]